MPLILAAQNSTNLPRNARLTGNTFIKGVVLDSETSEVIPQAAVQLYSLPDTISVAGTASDKDGIFTFQKLNQGNYVLRFSFLGYTPQEADFRVGRGDRNLDLGKFILKSEAFLLSEATIEADIPETEMVDDTLMFNAAAFHVTEGAVLEELVKKLPGVELDTDGTLKWNGKTVSRIMLDGRDYFGGDKQMALQNLPAEMVKRIKAYERKSDLARMTGIDDGNEEVVMDVEPKPQWRGSIMTNTDVAGGTPVGNNDYGDWVSMLYSGRFTVNRINRSKQFSVVANTGNAGRGGNGQSTNTQLGVNLSRTFGKAYPRRRDEYPVDISGNVTFNGSDSRSMNRSESETYLTTTTRQSFSNNSSNSSNWNRGFNGEFKMELRPDTMTSIIISPRIQYSTSGNGSVSQSASFNSDPYLHGMTVVLDEFESMPDTMAAIGVNSQRRYQQSYRNNFQVSNNLQFNRKFGNEGRNFTFTMNFSYQNNSGDSFSYSKQKYYQVAGRDTIMNRYQASPEITRNVSTRVMWSEPIARATYLQLSYQFQYRFQDRNQNTYQLPSNLYPDWYENWDLPSEAEIELFRKDSLSTYATYENFDQTIDLQLRRTTDFYNFNIGFSLMPQHSDMKYDHMGVHADTARTVFNWTPTANFRYRWSRLTSLQFTYRGSTSQPSMTQLLNITDNSNPLNISKGNPGLKPTFRNSMEVQFNTSNTETQRTYNASASLSNTLRNISNRTVYDEMTGVSTSQPVNMDGFWANWNATANFSYNAPFQFNTKFKFSSTTQANYGHSEGYMRSRGAMPGDSQSLLSTTKTSSVSERVTGTYMSDMLEVRLNGRVNYNHSINELQGNEQNTYSFSYGPSVSLKTKWHNFRVSSDANMQSRRGFSSAAANTDEFVWNATMSISMFKKNAGTLSVQWNDILNQESNFNRRVTTTGRTDTWNNTIHSYVMVHFILRINVFGSRQARQEMRENSRMRVIGDMPGGQNRGPGSFNGGPSGGMGAPGGMGGRRSMGGPGGGGFGGGGR